MLAGSCSGQGARAPGGWAGHAGAATGHQWGLSPRGAHLPHGGQWGWQNHPHGCPCWQEDMCVLALTLLALCVHISVLSTPLNVLCYCTCLFVCVHLANQTSSYWPVQSFLRRHYKLQSHAFVTWLQLALHIDRASYLGTAYQEVPVQAVSTSSSLCTMLQLARLRGMCASMATPRSRHPLRVSQAMWSSLTPTLQLQQCMRRCSSVAPYAMAKRWTQRPPRPLWIR